MLCFRDAGWRGLAEQATELLPQVVRSYRSALAYWSAWPQLRFGQMLGEMRPFTQL